MGGAFGPIQCTVVAGPPTDTIKRTNMLYACTFCPISFRRLVKPACRDVFKKKKQTTVNRFLIISLAHPK